MELQGEVTDIIYQNEVNSYTIAVIETVEDEVITCVGYLPFINVGDTLKVVGNFVVHKDYGEQFKVETFEKIMPQTLESLERYLSNGVIKGIGPATARKIIETFGEETVSIFKFEPQKLAGIKGISKEKALEMAEEFNENWDLWQIVGYLDKFGIGAENSKKIYKALGNNAINEIEENPYLLVDLIRNVDFVKIDKMAMDLGFSYNNDKRIRSGIKYALNK
ncbi:MAG: helix-hairpin-helix domain-containing protein, partial [Clostridia bacterium]